MGIDIEQIGDVRVLRWRDGENRFNADTVGRWHEVLDELEAVDGPLALVVTGDGKFFSNGLDLDAMAADEGAAGHIVGDVHRLFGRMLLFPAYTVAAVNGHAFAAGAMLACCFDLRIMRHDRGYWCLPEVDLGLPLTDAMFAAVTARMPRLAAADAMLTGRRMGGTEACDAGLVDQTASEHHLLDRAVEAAVAIAPKNRSVLATHKRMLFGEAARVCGWEPSEGDGI